jgi:NADPH:quinone reductase-like Zn-dependent oxidoreductase
VATAGSAAKLERCLALGAEAAVDHRAEDFGAAVRRRIGAVDVILDIGGAGTLERNLGLLAARGRLVVLALLEGDRAPLDLALLLRRRLRVIGSVLRSRSLAEKVEITRAFRARVWPLLVEGRVASVVHAVLPIARAEEAHRILAERRNIGKVVLTVRG